MVLRLTSVLFSTALGFTLAGGLLHAFQQPPRPAVQPLPAPPDVAAPPADAAKTASGLATKVLPLADDIVVLPGHGEQTSIGRERATNPFLLDLIRSGDVLGEGPAGRVTRGL